MIISDKERFKEINISHDESQKMMKNNNSYYFILRNYLLHEAIEELEKGDDQLFGKLEKALEDPYAEKFEEFFQKRQLGLIIKQAA